MKPVIGINCDYKENNGNPYSFLYRNYSEAIIATGGIPLLLPIIYDNNDRESLLKKINGLLLTGGDDVPAHMYGEQRHEKNVCVHPDKTVSDIALFQTAMHMKIPILAVCYGFQLANIALGGTLIQDIPSEHATSIIHKSMTNKQHTHTVSIAKGTLLYDIMRKEHITVNTKHHQAIKKLGRNLKDAAHSDDGIVEAIEGKNYSFLLGVQWHPESMINIPHQRGLFSALIQSSRNNSGV